MAFRTWLLPYLWSDKGIFMYIQQHRMTCVTGALKKSPADWYVNILSGVSGGLQSKWERGSCLVYENIAGGGILLEWRFKGFIMYSRGNSCFAGYLMGNALILLSKEVCHVLDQGFQAYFFHMWYNFQRQLIINIFYFTHIQSIHCLLVITCGSSSALSILFFLFILLYNSFNIIIILPSRKCLCRFSKASCMQKVVGKWIALCKFSVIWSVCSSSQTRFPLWGSGGFIYELWQKSSDPSGSRGNTKGTRHS